MLASLPFCDFIHSEQANLAGKTKTTIFIMQFNGSRVKYREFVANWSLVVLLK